MALSKLAIDVFNYWSGPGDVALMAEAYVVGEGVGAAREALVSYFLARVREASYVREGYSRISYRRTCGTRPASKDAMSDVFRACLYSETSTGVVCLVSARRPAYARFTRNPLESTDSLLPCSMVETVRARRAMRFTGLNRFVKASTHSFQLRGALISTASVFSWVSSLSVRLSKRPTLYLVHGASCSVGHLVCQVSHGVAVDNRVRGAVRGVQANVGVEKRHDFGHIFSR